MLRMGETIGVMMLVGSLAAAQDSVDSPPIVPDPAEPIAGAGDLYDLQLYALDASNDTTATAEYGPADEGCWLCSGDFGYQLVDASFTGSWYGFRWGPLDSRFGIASSDEGTVMLKSLSFGEMMIGRAFLFGSEARMGYFVVGSSTAPVVEEPPAEEPTTEEPPADQSPDDTAGEGGEANVTESGVSGEISPVPPESDPTESVSAVVPTAG